MRYRLVEEATICGKQVPAEQLSIKSISLKLADPEAERLVLAPCSGSKKKRVPVGGGCRLPIAVTMTTTMVKCPGHFPQRP